MLKNRRTTRGFDKHLQELLEAHPEVALEHAKLFAELPRPTQVAIIRRQKKLSRPRTKKDVISADVRQKVGELLRQDRALLKRLTKA